MSEHSMMDIIVPTGTGWIEIAAAFVAYFVIGFVWWGPLFGKKWGAYMGIEMGAPGGKGMGIAMILQAVGTFFVVYVLWHVMMAFTGTIENGELSMGTLNVGSALWGAFYTWLGFFLPIQLGRVSWEKAPWGLVGINAGGQLVSLMAVGLVFALL